MNEKFLIMAIIVYYEDFIIVKASIVIMIVVFYGKYIVKNIIKQFIILFRFNSLY